MPRRRSSSIAHQPHRRPHRPPGWRDWLGLAIGLPMLLGVGALAWAVGLFSW